MRLSTRLGVVFLLLLPILSSAQYRKNLNRWFIGANVGTTITHMDIRPAEDQLFKAPLNYFSYTVGGDISYHFTHGLGVVANFSASKVKGDEIGKQWGREFDTDLREIKLMVHMNFGRAFSFNKRRNMVDPYINAGIGPTWGTLNKPFSTTRDDVAEDFFIARGNEYPDFVTWNKNIQGGLYIYLGRYFDLDIRYNYTFFNEDFIDGASIATFANREWDKYSTISVGFRFKFGVNNRQTYEHTSWAREPIEEDTSLFNNMVIMEEYDDGLGNTVYKMRPGDNLNEEELTKIETKNDNDEMMQAIYNTLMNNPDLRDSLLKSLAKDLTSNDAFIVNISDNVCDNCKPQFITQNQTIIRDGDTTIFRNDGTGGSTKTPGDQDDGTANRRKDGVVISPPGSNDEFVLKDIYYDLDKYYIREDAAKTLDELVKIMKKYPTLRIELGSHTDCRNSKSYNLWLSQKRADAAVSYIICQGIDPCRLVAKGYGESQLVNNCACEGDVVSQECSKEQHQANRRTTVKILDYNYKPSANCSPISVADAQATLDAAQNSRNKSSGESYTVTDSEIQAANITKTAVAGYYVVVGASERPDYARAFANEVKADGNPESGIFYRNDKSYFVYLKRFDDYAEAMKLVKEMRCCGKYPDAWIHVYNK